MSGSMGLTLQESAGFYNVDNTDFRLLVGAGTIGTTGVDLFP